MRIDQLNYILGGYVRIAYHEPNKYPEKAQLSQDEQIKKYQSDEEYERIARLRYRKK